MKPSDLPQNDVLEELERVLANPSFITSPRLSRFLRFVVERTLAGDAGSLKESVVGTEVFDRPLGYDPKTEPIVRTEARRLRGKLQQFYEENRAGYRVEISMPRGAYVAEFTRTKPPTTPPTRLELVTRPSRDSTALAPEFVEVPVSLDELAAPAAATQPAAMALPDAAPLPPKSQLTKWRIGAVALAAAVTGVLLWWRLPSSVGRQVVAGPVIHFAIDLPAGQVLATENGPNLTLSPDGKWVAYTARQDGVVRLYVRQLEGAGARMIPGSEAAMSPAFSPDGKSIAAYQSGKLRRFAVEGEARDLASTEPELLVPGISWDAKAGILFNNMPAQNRDRAPSSVFRLADPQSRHVEQVTPVDLNVAGAQALMVQQVLSGGRQYLVSGRASPPHERFVALVAAGSGRKTIVAEQAIGGWYTPTGHLVFYRGGSLLAASLDLEKDRVNGPPVTVLNDVSLSNWQGPNMAVSQSGTLAYVPGRPTIPDRRLYWVDHAGREKPIPIPPGPYNPLDISPDGRQLLVAKFDSLEQDWTLWSYGLVDGASLKLAGPSPDLIVACWSRDGRTVIFGSKQHDPALGEILEKSADGSGAETQLAAHDFFGHFPQTVSADGKWVGFVLGTTPKTKGDIWLVDRRQPGHPVSKPLVESPGWDANPAISPDGRWIAYDTASGNEHSVVMQPFPNGGREVMVAAEGSGPIWSPDSRTIYYRARTAMMSVEVQPQAGTPVELFHSDYLAPNSWQRFQLLSPDGSRFLLAREEVSEKRRINIIVNWYSELAGILMPKDAR